MIHSLVKERIKYSQLDRFYGMIEFGIKREDTNMMKGGMGNLMKQAQKMQEQMQKMQEQLAEAETTGESGAGLVKVVMNGRHDVKRVELDDSVMEEDKEMLEDLLAAAVNDAVRKIEATSKDQMQKMTSGMGLPPGMKLPF